MSDLGMYVLIAYVAVGVITGILVARHLIPVDERDADSNLWRGLIFVLVAACWLGAVFIAALIGTCWLLGQALAGFGGTQPKGGGDV